MGKPTDEFTCAQCHKTFPKMRSDEDALAAADELWGDDLGDDPAVVCDPCFQMMTSAVPIAEFRESE